MNFIKQKICRKLLQEAIKGSCHSRTYGLGMILPMDEDRQLRIMPTPDEYDFFFHQSLQNYFLVKRSNNRILFVGSTNTTDFDKTHTPEEIIRYDVKNHWDMIMCIGAFVDANGNRKIEDDAINKFGEGFLSSLMHGKVKFQLHFE